MNKPRSAPAAIALCVGLLIGCGGKPRVPEAGGELTEPQIAEIKSFGGELIAEFGKDQPPLKYWVAALPWLKFKRLELRPDGCYFILDESGPEERGYVRVADPHEFYEAHKNDPGYEGIDVYLYRYRFRK
jgi:hypothetical protein